MPVITDKNVFDQGDYVTKNAAQFSRLLNEIGPAMKGNFELVKTAVVLRLWKEIIKRTPVKTGLARANWQIGVERNHDEVGLTPLSPDIKKMRKVDILFIFNNLPYIERLEAGSSTQAPVGMVGLALNSISIYLKQEMQKLGMKV